VGLTVFKTAGGSTMNSIQPKLATRLNSFAVKPEIYWPHTKTSFTIFDLLERAAIVKGLTHVDLNYPDHFNAVSLSEMRNFLTQTPLSLNGLAMRYSSDPCFSLGAFTHPDPRIR
jgi:xylose isomerase